MTAGQRRRYIQKEQYSILHRRHDCPPVPFERKLADDPPFGLKGATDAPLGVV
jgi:hypothetical protein